MHNHVSACVSSLRDIPGILHSGCSITLESLLHFYSLLFPCTLHKIVTRDLGWTLHSLAACEGSFMLISSEQNSWITVVLCMHPHLRDQRSATWKKKKNHFEHAYKVVLILLLNFFFFFSLILKGLLDNREIQKVAVEWCVAFQNVLVIRAVWILWGGYIRVTGCLSLNNIIDILNG